MSKLQTFGRSYSQVGDSNSDFIIKTRGLVKIQWGNKFIDLIKDGKIVSDSKVIFQTEEIGSKDGIYVVGELDEQSIWLVIDGEQINLKESGETYVSFMEAQETTPELKYQALQNIGFIYDNLSSLNENSLKNGIIYCKDELKLYVIVDGKTTEYQVEIPNPINKLLIILKKTNDKGAIVIKGEGIENSIAFNLFYLYVNNNQSYISSEQPIIIKYNDKVIINLNNYESTFNNNIKCNNISSIGSSSNSGFQLGFENGESFLNIDTLNVRNPLNSQLQTLYPEFIVGDINVIKQCEENGSGLNIVLSYNNVFNIDDILTIIDKETKFKYSKLYLLELADNKNNIEFLNILIELGLLSSTETFNDYVTQNYDLIIVNIMNSLKSFELLKMIELKVDSVNENIITTSIITQNSDGTVYNINDIEHLSNTLIFKKSSDNIRIKNNNIDIVEYSTTDPIKGAEREETIKTRIGLLDSLNKNISGLGVYSEQGYFSKASYTNDYMLDDNDNSSKFASTEWVNKLISNNTSNNKNFIKNSNNKDWGNSLCLPNQMIYNMDLENKIISSIDLTIEGTESNWNNHDWRKLFLMNILLYFLLDNIDKYNNGWNFDYIGSISSTGYEGLWFGRISEFGSKISNLNGNVIGNGGIVHFQFININLGKLRSDLAIGINGLTIGEIPNKLNCLYDVNFEKCNYKYESF